VTSIAPEAGTAADQLRRVVGLARQHRKVLGLVATVVILALLVLIDHSGPAAIIDQADGTGVAASGPITVTASGAPQLTAKPGSVHVSVDAAGLALVQVTLVSSAAQPLVVDADGRLLSAGTQLVVGFVSGGATVPAHGSAVIQLSGTQPFSTVGSVQLDLHAVPQPTPV
jgi:hypothetical protein